jgi:two-component system, LytTR family, sensor kinase
MELSPLRRWLRIAALYAAAWAPLVVIYSAVIYGMTDGQMSVGVALRAGLLDAIAPAVMGVGVWWITRRVPWPERRPARFIAVHFVSVIVFASAWTGWEYLMMGEAGRARTGTFVLTHMVLPWQWVLGVLLYGVIAAASYAVRGTLTARDLRTAAERSEKLRAQAELAVLRAHINPHFLFNTLHSVTTLLRGDPARAEAGLERLSDLFRYVLRLDRQRVELVTLEDEWQFAESYLWLERMRMGDRLTVDASLDDDALACAVPPFTLQPLVENAVRHGLSPKTSGGTVRVTAREAGGELRIEVSDDGVGADPARVGDGAGIGVRAVRQRLEARHGPRARTDISSRPGAGFSVILTLPAEPAPAAGPLAGALDRHAHAEHPPLAHARP